MTHGMQRNEGTTATTEECPQEAAQGRPAGNATPAFNEAGHQARLLDNHNYDLVEELSELLQGVWRLDKYLKDSGGKCDNCGRIWHDVRKQKELLIEKIRQEIVNHAKEGQFV